MLQSIEKTLKELVCLQGLAGHEQPVCAYLRRVFEDNGLQTRTDTFGNCIARLPGTDQSAPKIMVFAHMDSLGYLVRYIEADGFLRFERLGGISEKALPATEVLVQARDGKQYEGVIGVKAHHVTPPEEKYVVDRYTRLFVDIGAPSREAVKLLGIDVGAPIVHRPKYVRLQGTRVLGSFLDNRTGCVVLLELAERLCKTPHRSDIYLVGTVQEEYNLRGAMMAARTVKPDLAICVDGAFSADTPDLNGKSSTRLGGGPILSHYNFHGRGTLNGAIAHPGLLQYVEACADEVRIPLQHFASVGTLTDTSYLQLEGTGIKCVDVGIARRYSHSPGEVCDLIDIELLTKWLLRCLAGNLSAVADDR